MAELKLVLPGEQVATVEEYESGEGTFETEGKVYAGWVGVLEVDDTNKVVRVRPFNPPAELKEGDVVYATVNDIRAAMATAQVVAIHGRTRDMAGDIEGSLHVSKIASGYVDDIHGEMSLGDVVRARVDQVFPSVQISTVDRNLGVVRALCGNCRAVLAKKSENELKCPRCERVERRKLAVDYGDLNLSGVLEVQAPPVRERRDEGEFRPRREYGDRDRERGGRDRDERGRGGGRGDRGGGGRFSGRGGRGRGGGRRDFRGR